MLDGAERNMTKSKVLLIVQSLLCVLLVGLLAVTAIGIYREGTVRKAENPLEWIYTRDKVGETLRPVIPLLALSLVVTAVGLALGIRDEQAEKPVKDTECLRDLTAGRVAEPSEAMKAERARQKKLLLGDWGVFALCMVPVLLYMTNGEHFPNDNLEPVFLALIAHVLPWVALGFAALMISTALQEKSMQREIEAAQEQIRLEKAGGIRAEEKKPVKKPDTQIRMLRAAVLVLAVCLIIAGVFNGSARDVFGKAVKICTECVGLG